MAPTSDKANSCPQNISGVHGYEFNPVDSESADGQDHKEIVMHQTAVKALCGEILFFGKETEGKK